MGKLPLFKLKSIVIITTLIGLFVLITPPDSFNKKIQDLRGFTFPGVPDLDNF